VTSTKVRKEALAALARQHGVQLDLISMAILGKKVNFDKVSASFMRSLQPRRSRSTLTLQQLDGPERAAEQECNQQDCAGDEICVSQQDLIIAVDGSGSVQEGGFNTMKNYALNLFEKCHSQFRP